MLRWSVDVKNMRLVIVFDMLVNPSLKVKTGFANVSRTTVSTSKFYILGKISNHQELGIYMTNSF